jgi:DNA-directed RNA polymerase delta subunit
MAQEQSENSILDRVMSSQQDSLAKDLNPYEIVVKLGRGLSPREREVVSLRFGLGKTGEPLTLEAIGQQYKITRERVRQIEASALRKLRQADEQEGLVGPLGVVSQRVLEQHGGLMPEDMYVNQLLSQQATVREQRASALMLLDKLVDEVERIRYNDDLHPSWRLKATPWPFVEQTLAALHSVIEKLGEPRSFDDVLSAVKDHGHYQQHQAKLPDEAVESYLRSSAKVRMNPYGEWGLADWKTVNPRRMSDKIYLVLKKHGQPMHFTEIAKAINTTGFDHKTAYPATVHNELILDKKYVLVGRGTYALREWGYQPGVVADVIARVMDEAGEPLTKDEIVARVLKQRVVKPSTVALALMNRQRSAKLPGSRYSLVKS